MSTPEITWTTRPGGRCAPWKPQPLPASGPKPVLFAPDIVGSAKQILMSAT